MSDISLQFPWWFDVVALLAAAMWPLTVAAAAAGVWLWFKRSRWYVWVVTIPVLILWAISAATNVYGMVDRARSQATFDADLRSRQRTLAEATRVAGIVLPAKTVVTLRYGKGPGDLEAIDLPAAADVDGFPLIGRVEFDEAGKIHGTVTLARDATVQGLPCSAKANVIVLDGRLSTCTLARPFTVRGVPCTGEADVTAGVKCALSVPYARFGVTWQPQTIVDDSPMEGKTWFTIGPIAPSLRQNGKALSERTVVEYQHGKLAGINPGP